MGAKKPVVAITMGDPAGIGPEITLKSLSDPGLYRRCDPLVVGDIFVLRRALDIPGIPRLEIAAASSPREEDYRSGVVHVLDLGMIPDPAALPLGKVSALGGDAAFAYVEKAISLAMEGSVDATVTNPLNKEALNLAGHHFAGHTEIYAHFTGVSQYAMMLAHQDLRVLHVSTHVSLREACDRVKKDRVLEVIRMGDRACRDMGIPSPRVGVAGLNPHSGENGLFGREEMEEIIPAIEEARAQGIGAEGPVPPDSLFPKARGGWYDVVIAMYHDQGHIPLKMAGFVYDREAERWGAVEGVNITLGLPIIRTSVDHGTAFDQAGLGVASELSLTNAIEYAINFAGSRIGSDRLKEDLR